MQTKFHRDKLASLNHRIKYYTGHTAFILMCTTFFLFENFLSEMSCNNGTISQGSHRKEQTVRSTLCINTLADITKNLFQRLDHVECHFWGAVRRIVTRFSRKFSVKRILLDQP